MVKQEIRRFTVREALRWIGCGWRIWKKNLFFWWVAAFIYALLAFAVTRVPFLGAFVLLFVTPAMTASALSTVRQQVSPDGQCSIRYLLKRARSPQGKLSVLLGRPAKALFGGFADENRVLPLMGIGLATAVLGVLVQILSINIAGPVYWTPPPVEEMNTNQGLRLTLAYITTYTAYLVLIVFNIYFVAHYVLDQRPLTVAASASLRACFPNMLPCLVYAGALVIPLLLAGVAVEFSRLPGLVVFLLVGSVSIPLLINSAYCTSRLMYR